MTVTNPSGYSSLKERLERRAASLDQMFKDRGGLNMKCSEAEAMRDAIKAITTLEARIAQLEADRAQWVELPDSISTVQT